MSTKLQEIDPQAAKTLAGPAQAPNLESKAAVAEEAEGNKGILMHKLVEAAKAVAAAEDSMSKTVYAALVTAITFVIKLPVKIRPKYTEIQDTIVTAMGRTQPRRTFVKNPDETFASRFGTKAAYKQQATPFVDMARWEIGQYTKQEEAHKLREGEKWSSIVTIRGEKYTSPVAALSAGVAWSTVHTCFRNNLRPAFLDLSILPEKMQEKHGREHAQKGKKGAIMVSLRVTKNGEVVKARTPVLGNAALTHGVVLGLLGGLSGSVTPRRFSELQAALELIKPNDEPKA